MPDESRDPELEWVRTHWDAPPPGTEFHDRVLAAYVREAGRVPLLRSWATIRIPLPVAGAAVIGAFVMAWFAISYLRSPETAAPVRQVWSVRYYRPVPQPRFIVISQGEHP